MDANCEVYEVKSKSLDVIANSKLTDFILSSLTL